MEQDSVGSGGFGYIRWRYKVPARRGARVRLEFQGGAVATVLSTSGPHLWVRIDGQKRRFGPIHPTWGVTWLGGKGGER